MARDLLLEIGTEEIPARFMSPAMAALEKSAMDLFAKERLKAANFTAWGTPRRMALYVQGLEDRQEDLAEEIKGPPSKAAYDSEGRPTKAAEGFARSQGIAVEELVTRELAGNSYVFALRSQTGKDTAEILPLLLPQLIKELTFPKPMRWGNNDTRFARPIRWLVALYGNEIVNFTYAGVVSGRVSRGHRFLSQGDVAVPSAGDYPQVLEQAYVMVDQNRRKEIIWQQVEDTASAHEGMVHKDADLLEEVNYLLEYPTPLCGSYAEKYLALPQEVLVTSMREHQRYFPVYDRDGRMLPKFITLRNGTSDYLDIVKEGNEKVLRARLADAEFFYNEDRKTSLADKVHRLKNVVYQERLGSVFAKCERLQNLVAFLVDRLGGDAGLREDARRAAYLSKADLVTNMVIEFPELQGIMGRYYAQHDGEAGNVCSAIQEQYLPRFSGDVLPETQAGQLLSIADKLDNIVGCFALGVQPTGSQDPYALRRQALGICNIIAGSNLNLSFNQVFREAYKQYAEKIQLDLDYEEVESALNDFFRQRVINIMEEDGLRYDAIQAVLAAGWDNLTDALSRAHALSEFRKDPGFDALLTGFTRASNLAKKSSAGGIDPSLFEDAVESSLYNALQETSGRAEQQISQGNYLAALREIASLREPIDAFFDGVMVMVEEEKVRDNRLALLASVSRFMSSVADLSQVVPAQ